MPTDLKEPKTWAADTIPGLVKKKGKGNSKADTQVAVQKPNVEMPQVEIPTPLPEKTVPEPTKEVAPPAIKDEAWYDVARLSPAQAHEELMNCLIDAQTVAQKIRAASDTYHFVCDYLESRDNQQYVPVINSIMRTIEVKDPNMLLELVDTQANEIVDGWQTLQSTANKAVSICELLIQQSRAQAIDSELKKLEPEN